MNQSGQQAIVPLADSNSTVYWMSLKTARFVAVILVLVGIECWLNPGQAQYGHEHQPLLMLGALVAALIPPVRNSFNKFWERSQRISPRAHGLCAMVLAIASSFFLSWCNAVQNKPAGPKYHDEFSYLVQIQLLARGRLWLPAHPLGKYFETFYLITDRVYASMYFPGTAMMFCPVIWLHVPTVVGPLAAAGICVGLIYLVVSEILDVPSGWLAALCLLAYPTFRMLSMMIMSQIPVLLLGLLMTWAWLRWRRRFFWGWLLLLGAAAGWAAITRPGDALAFGAAIGISMIFDLWRQPPRAWGKTALLLIVGASPFFSIQLIFNHGVTGHWLETPFDYYTERFYPGAQFGFRQPPGQMPQVSDLPQKQLFFQNIAWGQIRDHTLKHAPAIFLDRVKLLAQSPAVPFFWLLIPLSALAMWHRRFWGVWGVIPIFILIYTCYSFFLFHYLCTLGPAFALLTVLPIRLMTDLFPRATTGLRTGMGLGIAALAFAIFPPIDHKQMDQHFNAYELDEIDSVLRKDVQPPAVVLFHFNLYAMVDGKRLTNDPELEPVFNIDVADVDDAPIIRAHDLNRDIAAIGKPGDRDLAIYAYYARSQPGRVFYVYNRLEGFKGKLIRLGTASEMAQKAGGN